MTKAEAKKWCIKKWEYIAKINGSKRGLIQNVPELKKFDSNCAYCQFYRCEIHGEGSRKCPLVLIEKDCFRDNSPFTKWNNTRTKKAAQAMLDSIKKS